MKSIKHTVFVPVVLLLATLFTTGIAQADDKTHDKKEHDKTSELKITGFVKII